MRYFFNAGLYDSSLQYARKTIDLAKNIKDEKGLAIAYFNISSVCTNLTMYDTALHYMALAEEVALQHGDSMLLVSCYNTSSTLYRYQSDFGTALDLAIKGAKIAERSTDSVIIKMLPLLYQNITTSLKEENQLVKAIEYGEKALLFKNYPDEQRYRILLLLDIADAYMRLSQPDKAKPYLDSAVKENNVFNNIILDILTANTQGAYYDHTEMYLASLEAFQRSYRYCDSAQNDYLKAEAASSVANIFIKQKQFQKALPYAFEGNKIGIRLKHFKIVAATYNSLKEIATASSDYRGALEYARLQEIYSDSATNEATQKATLNLEKKYQSQKKEKEIADLTIANTAQELDAVKRNRLLWGGGIAAISILIILSLLYRNSRQKRLIATKENTLQQEQIKFLERQQQVVSLQSMVNGQETERTRIAKDLHDGLGGLFSTIKMFFSTLKHEQKSLQDNALFAKSYEMIDTASEEVRRIAHNMMPEVLMKLGLVHALQDMCTNINAGKIIKVKLQSYGMEDRMNASTEIMLYRIVQELLNNIIKHAEASEVIVQLNREEDRLMITVEDNGRGFHPQEAGEKDKHSGLAIIKSRVNYLNGYLSIDSQSEVGTTVLMEFLISKTV